MVLPGSSNFRCRRLRRPRVPRPGSEAVTSTSSDVITRLCCGIVAVVGKPFPLDIGVPSRSDEAFRLQCLVAWLWDKRPKQVECSVVFRPQLGQSPLIVMAAVCRAESPVAGESDFEGAAFKLSVRLPVRSRRRRR